MPSAGSSPSRRSGASTESLLMSPNDITIKLGLDDAQLPAPVQRVNAAIGSIGKTGEISARQTAAAMRQLPAQFTDVATQLAGGQNPLLILLQQGGQIKDSFGGIGPAIHAVTSAITPAVVGFGALAAGVGAFALAALQGQRESAQLRDTMALTGNAAGLSGARFQALAETTAAASEQSTGSARQIILELARTGQVSSSVISSTATAVARMADVTGQDTKKIAADFATMSGGVAKWAAEHNKAWNFITAEQYKYISRLEQQGKAEEAAIFVNQRVIEQLGQQKESIGLLEGAWNAMGRAAKDAWDDMLAIGRDATDIERVRNLIFKRDRAERVQGTPILEWLMGSPEEIQKQIDTANRDLVRNVERGMAASSKAITERQKIEAERKREADAAKTRAAPKDREKPYIPSEFQVLDARDGMVLAAAREKAESAREAFFDEVLRKDDERQAKKLDGEVNALQQLFDANQRAGAELLEDERQRGEALIALDLQIARRRIEAQGLSGGARDEALRLLDEQALLSRRRLEVDLRKSGDKLAEDTGKALYDDTRDAISAAFRDSKNPIEAFGNALANTIFTRATSSLVDALATAAVGANGRGGGLGDLINLIGSFAYSGSSTDVTAPNYENSFDRMNPPKLATGTNYVPRNMMAMLHKGEAVVPARYNPAAGGAGSGIVIHNAPQISIDARADQAQVASLVSGALQQNNAALIEDLQARGMLVS